MNSEGKIVWPLAEGQTISVADAFTTLFSISDAELDASFFDEKGDKQTDVLHIEVYNCYEDESEGKFFRKSLKDLLIQSLEDFYEDPSPQERKIKKLLAVLEEPLE